MKLSTYIPIALAVTAVVFWLVPLKPDEVFYPIREGGVPVTAGAGRINLTGQLLLECHICKQTATQANSRLEPGTRLRQNDGRRLACDKHAFVPMRERYGNKINATYAVLLPLTLIGVVMFFRRWSPKVLAARGKPVNPA